MRKNDLAEVTVTDMNTLGYGVGHIDGKAVFLPDCAPGDRVEAKIIKDSGRFFVGRCVRILKPSELRAPDPCPAFPKCGGCAFCHVSYEYEKKQKEAFLRGFFQKEGLEIEVLPILTAGSSLHYRNKVQYPYKDGVLGYYAPHSHRVVPNDGCLLHLPAIEEISSALKAFLKEYPVQGYDEESGAGLLRHVCLRSDREGREILLTLVLNGRSFPYEKELIAFLGRRCPPVKGLYYNVNEKNTNVIYGREFLHVWGEKALHDTLLSCRFEISPASFYQVNHDACELLYSEVIRRAALKGGETVADLFCGIGTIGLCLMKRAPAGCRLIGVEIVPEAVENAEKNARVNGIENASFYVGDANHPALGNADVVIVDPPRKGLDEALIDRLTGMKALKKIVYVSCGPDTLARDLARFLSRGWSASSAQPVDMFPRTGHVETVVLMSRGG